MPLATIFAYKYPPLSGTFTPLQNLWIQEPGLATSHFLTEANTDKNTSKIPVICFMVITRMSITCTYVMFLKNIPQM